jgi:hypothetical protein
MGDKSQKEKDKKDKRKVVASEKAKTRAAEDVAEQQAERKVK